MVLSLRAYLFSAIAHAQSLIVMRSLNACVASKPGMVESGEGGPGGGGSGAQALHILADQLTPSQPGQCPPLYYSQIFRPSAIPGNLLVSILDQYKKQSNRSSSRDWIFFQVRLYTVFWHTY